jgi:predicted ThiF/HesA family dinucleotide-utilizing enzyme
MPAPGIRAVSLELIEELMGAVVAVDFVLQTLMDLPADALPGENKAEAIRELLTASACREVEAVGEEACRAAIALIEKVVDRIADDASAAADLAGAARHRPC